MKKEKIDIYNRAKVIMNAAGNLAYTLYRAKDNVDVWEPVVGQRTVWRPKPYGAFHGWLAYRVRPPKKVYVHVRGGVAYCDRVPKDVVVKIVDHDNEGR
jgi:hypothetical protein